jgi:hypothetical protein
LWGEQNETGLEGELSEDVGPTVEGWFWGLGYDPELAVGMMNDRHGLAGGGTDGSTATEEVDLVIGVDAAAPVQRQMQVQQAGDGTGSPARAAFGPRLGRGFVGGEAGGAADRAVLAGQFAVEQGLGGGVGGDVLVGEQGDEALLKSAEPAFDFTLGLGAGGDEVGDAQRGESALELGAGIAPVGGGHMAEQGQPVGVEGEGQAVSDEEAAEVLKVMPSGVGGNKGGPEEQAGVVVHGEQEGLLVVRRPPLVDGGVMLPEFADPGALPATARLGGGGWGVDQEWEVVAGVGGDGFAVTAEGQAGGEFVGDELEVGRALKWQEGLEELLNLGRPAGAVVAAGEFGAESNRLMEAGGAETEELSAADAQEFCGGKGVKLAAMESVEGLEEESLGEAFGELMFFKRASKRARPRRASPFVSLRYAPAHERAGPAEGSLILLPPSVSFCSRPDRTIRYSISR